MSTIPQPQVSVLDAYEVGLLAALQPYMEDVRYAAGEVIFKEGEPGEEFMVLTEGDVRIEKHSMEVDSDNVVDYANPGHFVGEVAVLSGQLREASAIAETDVVGRKVSRAGLRRMFDEDPKQGIQALRALARDVAMKYTNVTGRLADFLSSDTPDPEVDRMVALAAQAQKEFEHWDEPRVDALLQDLAMTVAQHAQELAEATVAETTLGNVEDKVFKISFAALGVQGTIAGETGYGVIGVDEERKVTEIAAPVGVVFGLVPVTNPVPTFINKTLICLKGRNAIILSCHRMSQGIANRTGELLEGVLRRHGAPEGIMQWVKVRGSRKRTAKFMHHDGVGMILATGGPGMVKAAYSSGKPAIGVGAGNAPAWFAADADALQASRAILNSKTMDNGLICGSEQHLVVDASIYDEVVRCLRGEGAAVLDEAETRKFVDACFDPQTNHLQIQYVGRSAELIAQAAALPVPAGTKLLVFSAGADLAEEVFGRERLAPVVSLFKVDGDDEAIDLCKRLLSYEGAGHTAVIHTSDIERRDRFAREMPASRVLVNAPAAQGCCGVVTGLNPTLTLGCGTWGGNSTTDNVGYKNMLNVKRMAEGLL